MMHPDPLPTTPLIASYLPPGHDPFADAQKAPGAVLWTRVYAGVVVAFSLVSLVYAGFFWPLWNEMQGTHPSGSAPSFDAFQAIFLAAGVVMALFALAQGALSVYLVICPRKPLTYTLGTVVLILSCLSSGCMPLGAVLLVFWLKPEVKAWFAGSSMPPPAGF